MASGLEQYGSPISPFISTSTSALGLTDEGFSRFRIIRRKASSKMVVFPDPVGADTTTLSSVFDTSHSEQSKWTSRYREKASGRRLTDGKTCDCIALNAGNLKTLVYLLSSSLSPAIAR